MYDLDGVHHHHPGFKLFQRCDYGLRIGFGHHSQPVCGQPQPVGAHGNLLQGFLTGYIEGVHGRGEVAHGLQQQRALARPRVAPHQDGRTRNQTTAQYAVKFAYAGGETRQVGQVDFPEHAGAGQRPGESAAVATAAAGAPGALAGGGPKANFRQGIPGAAIIALALPLGVIRATIIANEGGFLLGHSILVP